MLWNKYEGFLIIAETIIQANNYSKWKQYFSEFIFIFNLYKYVMIYYITIALYYIKLYIQIFAFDFFLHFYMS